MVALKAGCVLERLPPLSARKALRYFEYAPRAPLPKFATLARFRKQWGPDAQVALVCPKSAWTTPKGAFRASPELDAGIAWVTRVADILGAFAIVVATGAELSPGARDRDLLRHFVERLQATKRQVIIAPRGLWEAESAGEFAKELGCLYGFDPLEDDAPPGPLAYARVRPMGARPRLTDGHLLQILERARAGGAEEVMVAIEAEDAYRAMKRLQGLAAELPEDDEVDDDELDGEAFVGRVSTEAAEDSDEPFEDEGGETPEASSDEDEERDEEERDDEDDDEEERDDEDDEDDEEGLDDEDDDELDEDEDDGLDEDEDEDEKDDHEA